MFLQHGKDDRRAQDHDRCQMKCGHIKHVKQIHAFAPFPLPVSDIFTFSGGRYCINTASIFAVSIGFDR